MPKKKLIQDRLAEEFLKASATARYAAHDADPLDVYHFVRIADEAEFLAREAAKLTTPDRRDRG